ncbi:MAG: hypothetical protein A3B91_03640 [Candidatus Yanofskybacteria bacterium RIFCSPHIGHO2_02_FULL_41_29]|uniref:Aspartyl/glutamyl-tRNA(Asn/Gln) amidotransferase subunit C n=1 Tax=Candidatus Yanofskybacteria bacterium RIFCSPHIGHO2_01_FULL_41_53 TaxID=1802663 RepID=A0A1F8EMV9_9BACT|nr:MAG: hypothetical protein A2650_00705 [Candidatus Yanofskybacteria bacterium RIFCSPHIGHO2_01_FULL_41_53]OGN10851.1 MAG: hypothetical protein A3B91_03640 [Candidatus Yanofskybacteria bacterium RIFCSPHIGHO2_02_FULL_41_29]OGN18537.1 MAG: hypothetical protein A3F48_01175 [Candidatus Yanofskybacteria bacterium RIFCSPHIGHO2_12_FULL_41_9]OGN24486.1 MAG: hypothetical protein A2916_02540 [Candidatus Yanofskybacteria bacterium RIFCSPLOWO2_01_FULL_41_67]OGN29520.1 MAG: hypothetical protein A3H54_01280 
MDIKTVNKISALARIAISPEEEVKIKNELSSILDYIGQLNKVNTEEVEPFYQTTGIVNSTRPDKYREDFKIDGDLNKKLIDQAPDRQDNFIKVKSILSR